MRISGSLPILVCCAMAEVAAIVPGLSQGFALMLHTKAQTLSPFPVANYSAQSMHHVSRPSGRLVHISIGSLGFGGVSPHFAYKALMSALSRASCRGSFSAHVCASCLRVLRNFKCILLSSASVQTTPARLVSLRQRA